MQVFLDIGAHIGETLAVVSDPRWGFEKIVCFEPAPVCWPRIEASADHRVELCRFGLWHRTETLTLHNPGDVGASMAADKNLVTESSACEFRDAAEWFAANVSSADTVYAKINVEGAEADIIDRLFSAGELLKIDHLLIHFDVRKVPSLRHREAPLRQQLAASGVEYQLADDIMFGGVVRGTRNWLRWCHGAPRTRDLRFKTAARAGSRVRRRLYPLKKRLLARR